MKKTPVILLIVITAVAFGSISVSAAGYGHGHGYGLKALKCTGAASCRYCGVHTDCFYDENGNGICDNYEARTSHITAVTDSDTSSGSTAASASGTVSGVSMSRPEALISVPRPRSRRLFLILQIREWQ